MSDNTPATRQTIIDLLLPIQAQLKALADELGEMKRAPERQKATINTVVGIVSTVTVVGSCVVGPLIAGVIGTATTVVAEIVIRAIWH